MTKANTTILANRGTGFSYSNSSIIEIFLKQYKLKCNSIQNTLIRTQLHRHMDKYNYCTDINFNSVQFALRGVILINVLSIQ